MGISLVTGANRGIGLEFCRQLAARGASVVAACRHSSTALDGLGVRVGQGVDVAETASIDALRHRLAGEPLDLLINNAGIGARTDLDSLDFDEVARMYAVNAIGPLRVTAGLLPLMHPGSKVAIITSRMGSIADNTSGGWYSYRMSKAAVNAAGVSLAHDLRPRGIAVAILHPGMVETDMLAGIGASGSGADPAIAVRGLLARIDELTLETSGTFWHGVTGETLRW
jgi:NAD(P)-dependent dehydrogenase (short-subunit alcohol dehydrogenase family)